MGNKAGVIQLKEFIDQNFMYVAEMVYRSEGWGSQDLEEQRDRVVVWMRDFWKTSCSGAKSFFF